MSSHTNTDGTFESYILRIVFPSLSEDSSFQLETMYMMQKQPAFPNITVLTLYVEATPASWYCHY